MNVENARKSAEQYLESAEGSAADRIRFVLGLWDVQAEIEPTNTRFELPSEAQAVEVMVSRRPLFSTFTPKIDAAEFTDALVRVARYVSDAAQLPENQVSALRTADFAALIDDAALADAPRSPEAWVGACAARLAEHSEGRVSVATAAFVLHSALVPFLAVAAAHVEAPVRDMEAGAWDSGDCPVCGAAAALGRMGESTKLSGADRSLWCATCHTEWSYARIRCARCGCRSADKLRYTYIEGDAAHRLHLCDECHGYVKTVFEDDLGSVAIPAAEDAVTTRLDALAAEKGYTASGDGGSGAC